LTISLQRHEAACSTPPNSPHLSARALQAVAVREPFDTETNTIAAMMVDDELARRRALAESPPLVAPALPRAAAARLGSFALLFEAMLARLPSFALRFGE